MSQILSFLFLFLIDKIQFWFRIKILRGFQFFATLLVWVTND